MRSLNPIRTLLGALTAPDPSTRRMARLFWLSLGLAVFTVFVGSRALITSWRATNPQAFEDTQTADNLSKLVSRQKQSAKAHASTLGLGRFHFELKGSGKGTAPVSNSAEVEIYVECDQKSTCDQVEANPIVLRDQLSTAIVGQERDSLLTPEGKLRLKRAIQRKLNVLVKDGTIRQVYFSDFVLN